jgi:hypothetical protein
LEARTSVRTREKVQPTRVSWAARSQDWLARTNASETAPVLRALMFHRSPFAEQIDPDVSIDDSMRRAIEFSLPRFDEAMQLTPWREPVLRLDGQWHFGLAEVLDTCLKPRGDLPHRSLHARVRDWCAAQGVA